MDNDESPSRVVTNALQTLPFGSIIGGPLKACIEAQAMAAKTSWDYIQKVDLIKYPKTGEEKTANVSFQFIKNECIEQPNAPLPTIPPVP